MEDVEATIGDHQPLAARANIGAPCRQGIPGD